MQLRRRGGIRAPLCLTSFGPCDITSFAAGKRRPALKKEKGNGERDLTVGGELR
jgi:hypothetical protein